VANWSNPGLDKEARVIDIRGLSKNYGEFAAVTDLNLTVEAGEIIAFLGPNGAGKTTTIRMLMGILIPTSGQAFIKGLDCFKDRVEVKRRVGYLPDTLAFYDYVTGRELLEFLGEMHGLSRADSARRAGRLLEEFTLEEAGDEYAVNYSLGMKKKLGLAGAVLHEPDVLLLDEPTNGLDPRAAYEVDERLRSYAQSGKTVFLSTHLLDRAEKLHARIAIIDGGKLVATGPVEQLRHDLAQGGTLEDVYLKVTEKADAPEQVTSP
jgi:ABC-2 type transport system ATP-binding protein